MKRKKRILIVDDNDIHRKIIRDALELRGYLVESACDGLSALRKLEEKPYDFLITDNLMPGMKGLELIDETSRKRIPIKSFLISGELTREITKEAKEKGVVACFDKTVSLKTMVNQLREIVCLI